MIMKTKLKLTSRSQVNTNELAPYDILCGRSKQAFNNVGNRRFRVTISLYLDRYLEVTSKKGKGDLIVSIVRYLRGECVGARFLKKAKGSNRYIELREREAREKVGHALRDLAVSIHQSTMAEWKAAQKKCKHQEQEQKKSKHFKEPETVVPEYMESHELDHGEDNECFHQALSLFMTTHDDCLL
jgi:hypothetical protein